ncbi:MAG: Tad domain-containing protein [Hyphomicrobiales bacterium]|nr:Tad domain-containing protein [Hyphomicrobiales bacterium]
MVLVALAAPAIVGLAALAVEGGYAYSQHAAMQSVSDLAALSAAEARTRDGNAANPTLEARAIAAQNGYVNNVGDVTVSVNSPPTTGTYPNGSVEVIVSRQQKPILMSLFRKTAYTIAGRSVAVAGATGNGCILALDTSSSDTGISAGGSPVVNMPNCAAYSNSPATDSAYIGGSASVTLHSLYAVGGINGTLVAGVLHTGVGALADPYAGKFTTPTNPFNTCTYRSSSKMPVNGTQVVPPSNGPAYICYSVNLNASDVLNLGPGTYIFDGAQNGALKATGQSSLIANGATLVFINGADVALNGGGATTIVAPTTVIQFEPLYALQGPRRVAAGRQRRFRADRRRRQPDDHRGDLHAVGLRELHRRIDAERERLHADHRLEDQLLRQFTGRQCRMQLVRRRRLRISITQPDELSHEEHASLPQGRKRFRGR